MHISPHKHLTNPETKDRISKVCMYVYIGILIGTIAHGGGGGGCSYSNITPRPTHSPHSFISEREILKRVHPGRTGTTSVMGWVVDQDAVRWLLGLLPRSAEYPTRGGGGRYRTGGRSNEIYQWTASLYYSSLRPIHFDLLLSTLPLRVGSPHFVYLNKQYGDRTTVL